MKYLFTLLMLISISTYSQIFDQKMVYGGYAITKSGEIIRDSIGYDMSMDIIFFKNGETIKVHPAQTIKYFTIWIPMDDNKIFRRHFYSFEFKLNENSSYKRNHFFELLWGGYTEMVLSREIIEYSESFIEVRNFGMVIYHDYYIANGLSGDITNLRIDRSGYKKRIYSEVDKYTPFIKWYISDAKLNVYYRNDLIEVVKFYDRLKYQGI